MIARRKSTRGMSLTLVAISLTAMCGVGALAIDLGMMYKAHGEARVAAEAAALAGASVFLDPPAGFFIDSIRADSLARHLALENEVLNRRVDSSEVEVVPNIPAQTVSVRVRRPGIATWFARVLNTATVRIGAVATASVVESSAANCVSPIMVPDAWGDDTEDSSTPWEDQIDDWTYGDPGDSYGPYNQPGAQTGYGSSYRNSYNDYTNDYGRPITLSPSVTGPGNFRLWTFQGENADIEERTTECDPRSVSLGGGNQYTVVQNENLPLSDLQDMIDDDPGTSWNTSGMQSTSYPHWRSSPRVLRVALYDPVQMQNSSTVSFNNIVLFFLESVDASAGSVSGRLLFYAPGNTDEGTVGTLVKRVKLIR
jgi:Putative Flp pilus-assembly TadE/G-like